MNRKELLATARDEGYEGPADLTEVTKYLTDNNITIKSKGKPIDLKVAWDTPAVAGDADPGDEDPSQTTQTKSVPITPEEAEEFKTLKKAAVQAARGKGAPKHGTETPPSTSSIVAVHRKNYERKIATGQAVFTDVDHAEHFGAQARLAIAEFNGIKSYAQRENDLAIVGKTATTVVNASAGVLIPPEYVANLIYLTEKYGVARRLANLQRMSRDVQMFPRKTAIITLTHTAENTSPTSQDVTYDLVELVARKVMGTSVITNELLEDSAINVADDLATSYAEAYGIKQDQDYFLGDGTNTYGGQRGLANALPTSAYVSGSGNSWSAITAADLDKLPGTVENVDVKRCAYVSSRQFFYQRVNSLDTAASQFKALVGPGINGSDASYKGWPWWFSQVLPTASASASKVVYFGDYAAGSMIGERRDFSIAASEHVNFTSDAMTYRASARYAVNIHGDGRGSTYGPILCLKTT